MGNREIPTVSMFRFLRNANRIVKNPLPFHNENFEKHGDTFQLHLGFGRKVIFSRDAGFAEYALQKNQKNYIKSPIQTRDLAKYVGHGLLTSNGEHWAKQRKLIQPAFHKKQLVGLLESMQKAIKVELEKVGPGKPFDVFPLFNDLAFQVVAESLFSSAVGEEEIERLQYITEANQKMLVRELRLPFKRWWFQLSGQIREHLKLSGEARDILQKLVEERKQSGKRRDDLLDMLLQARYEDGSSMNNEQLIDEILILFTAGHETTSNALTFTCELLARHPRHQEKIYREVISAREKTESLFGFIKECSYTRQVIEESMRLYPPAYFIDRVNLTEDSFGPMSFPANSSLLFSIYGIHRNKKYWNAPDKFDPARFSDPLAHSSYYFSFGAGPRKCIGSNFAMYEMVLTITEIVSNYKISSKRKKIEILPLITLKPKNAFLQFEKRLTPSGKTS